MKDAIKFLSVRQMTFWAKKNQIIFSEVIRDTETAKKFRDNS